MSFKKEYNRKRPSHPDDVHTKSKRFFKRKGRKRNRKYHKKITIALDIIDIN